MKNANECSYDNLLKNISGKYVWKCVYSIHYESKYLTF